MLFSKQCHQQSRRVSRASIWSPTLHASHGRAPGTRAFWKAVLGQMESRIPFQQVPMPVPSCETADRAGAPVRFSVTHKAVDCSSEHKGSEQPCILRPTTDGSGPLPSMSTNMRAPTIRGKAATRDLSGAAYDTLTTLQRAIRKPIKEQKCCRI